MNHYQLHQIRHHYHHATMSRSLSDDMEFKISSSIGCPLDDFPGLSFTAVFLHDVFSCPAHWACRPTSSILLCIRHAKDSCQTKWNVQSTRDDADSPRAKICQLPDFSLLRISNSTMARGMTPRTRVCVPRILLASEQERAPSTKVRIMPM